MSLIEDFGIAKLVGLVTQPARVFVYVEQGEGDDTGLTPFNVTWQVPCNNADAAAEVDALASQDMRKLYGNQPDVNGYRAHLCGRRGRHNIYHIQPVRIPDE